MKYPERIARIYENEKVSYKMLRLYALRAANYMWQRGVRRNDKIVVILPRGIGQRRKTTEGEKNTVLLSGAKHAPWIKSTGKNRNRKIN